MLTAEYLDRLPDRLVEKYAELEQEILADMARRISRYDYYIPSAEHQRQKLIEMGIMHDDIVRYLSHMTGRSQSEIKQLMEQACEDALESDKEYYRRYKITVPRGMSPELQAILAAGLKATQQEFRNLTRTTAVAGQTQFINALDKAWLQVSTGTFDYNTAIRNAIKDVTRQGLNAVVYPSGHVDTIEVAARRAILTGVNQTAGKMQWELADELGCDLVETTAHGGARPDHAAWQGRIFSRSGKNRKYPDFVKSTGYGTGAGLMGWNCRHSYHPYVDGAERAYTPELLKEYEAKKYQYNGKKMTEYEVSQEQRYIERQIRRWERERKALEAAGQDAQQAEQKVKAWRDRMNGFIDQTDMKRQAERERVY